MHSHWSVKVSQDHFFSQLLIRTNQLLPGRWKLNHVLINPLTLREKKQTDLWSWLSLQRQLAWQHHPCFRHSRWTDVLRQEGGWIFWLSHFDKVRVMPTVRMPPLLPVDCICLACQDEPLLLGRRANGSCLGKQTYSLSVSAGWEKLSLYLYCRFPPVELWQAVTV